MKLFKVILLTICAALASQNGFALGKKLVETSIEGIYRYTKVMQEASFDDVATLVKSAIASGEKATMSREQAFDINKKRVYLMIDAINNALKGEGFTPLMKAVIDQDAAEVRRLIESGEEIAVSAVRKEEVYSQGFLIAGGESPLLLASMTGNREIMQILREAGASAAVSDYKGVDPLVVSILRSDLKAAEIALEAGADLNKRPIIASYDYPIVMAKDANNPWMVELILRTGKVDMDTPYKDGTIGSVLVEYSDMLRHGLDKEVGDKIASHLFKLYKLDLFQ